jgi:tetratricopeptide (TPR) repeat protein
MIWIFLFLLFCFPLASKAQVFDTANQEQALLYAIQQNPNNPELRETLGELYYNQGEYQKAIQEFQTAVSLDPSNLRGKYDLGFAEEAAGHYKEAIRSYQDAMASSLYHLNFRLGVCYIKMGNYSMALDCFQTAKKVQDSAGVEYGMALAEAGLLNYKEALADLHLALAQDPKFQKGKEFFLSQAQMEQTRQNWEDAQKERAILKFFLISGVLLFISVLTFWTIRVFFKRLNFAQEEEF